jgi:hypothetical protein
LLDLIDQTLRREDDEAKGSAALDNDEDDLDAFRELLSRKGLSEEAIDAAVALVRGGGTEDELPNNAIGNDPPIKQRLEAKDLESEYPGISDYPDTVTLGQLDPNRNGPGYRSEVREASEKAMRRVAGAGTGMRLKTPAHTPTGDAALVTDFEDIELELAGTTETPARGSECSGDECHRAQEGEGRRARRAAARRCRGTAGEGCRRSAARRDRGRNQSRDGEPAQARSCDASGCGCES